MSGSGTSHFKQQRLTAMANVPLVLFLLWFIITKLGLSRAELIVCLKDPIASIGLVLALASIFWHMWLGMQVIIEDYLINSSAFRLAMAANTMFVATMAVLSLYAILKMSFGF